MLFNLTNCEQTVLIIIWSTLSAQPCDFMFARCCASHVPRNPEDARKWQIISELFSMLGDSSELTDGGEITGRGGEGRLCWYHSPPSRKETMATGIEDHSTYSSRTQETSGFDTFTCITSRNMERPKIEAITTPALWLKLLTVAIDEVNKKTKKKSP